MGDVVSYQAEELRLGLHMSGIWGGDGENEITCSRELGGCELDSGGP